MCRSEVHPLLALACLQTSFGREHASCEMGCLQGMHWLLEAGALPVPVQTHTCL